MKKAFVILCSVLVFLCSCGKLSENKKNLSTTPTISVSKSKDYSPVEFKKFPLSEEWKKILDKIPEGMTRHYITDSVNRRDVYSRGIVLTDEQEGDSVSVHTRYYIYFDEGFFLAERSVYAKKNLKRVWVEFNEEEELDNFLNFIKKTEKEYSFKR